MGSQPISLLRFHFWIINSSQLQYGGSSYISLSVHLRIESSLPFQCGPLNSVWRSRSTNKPHYVCAATALYSVKVLHVANWFAGNKIRPAYFPSRCLWCIVHIWTILCDVHVEASKSANVNLFDQNWFNISVQWEIIEKKHRHLCGLWRRLWAGVSLASNWMGICPLVLL